MKISIIIPVLNESKGIGNLIGYLKANSKQANIKEIIVVDGQSADNTLSVAKEHGVITLVSEQRGRAYQMNTGSANAAGDILYFLHADSFPPSNFDASIIEATKNNCVSGCFRMKWDKQGWFLRFFSWMTRFDYRICRGGDQSLFIFTETFRKIHGFRPDFRIMEDIEIISRLKKEGKFIILPGYVTTSSRRYAENGVFKLQLLFGLIHLMYSLGFSQPKLCTFYQKTIR